VINLFTIAKLAPLAVFIVVGLWFIDASRLTPLGPVSLTEVSTGAFLLVFAFGGYEVIGIPAGEAADPRRHVPFAFVTTIVAATAVMTLTQIVAMGTLPNLATSTTPIAERNRPARDVHKRQRGDYPTASPILPGRSSAGNFRHSIGRARATTRNNRVVADAHRSQPPTVAWRCGRAPGGCGTVCCE
jgi:amino acid transporter